MKAAMLVLGLLLPGTADPGGVPRRPTAEAQLELAREARRALRGRTGAARDEARSAAVEACRAVRRYFPDEAEEVTEAAFRAGELLRSGADLEGAVGEFEVAWREGRQLRLGARAGLEVGHTLRRLGRRMDALGWYEGVEALGATWAEERDLAAYWRGRVLEELGRPRDARRAFERAAREGVGPVQRVRAFDAWAGSWIETGDLEAAAGVLELCRRELAGYAAERTLLGLRVRSALDGMRAPQRLADAVRQRRQGSEAGRNGAGAPPVAPTGGAPVRSAGGPSSPRRSR